MPSLRSLLPRTFGTFLGRFPRPTEVQEKGIPAILDGGDVLLCAPTASGKTEAYMAPLVERLIGAGKRRTSFSLLVISPTRALANDLKRRLEPRMLQLQVSFGRYTGEHKERIGGKLPEVAVATPETLDSLLARRQRTLKGLDMVVLDEIHVLDGTPRGDQLRVLIHRLGRLTEGRLHRVAASATVSDPEALASRYLDEAAVVRAGGGRAVRARAFDGKEVDSVVRHVGELAQAGFRKLLLFCNARRDVEMFATELRGRTAFRDKIFAHHGSLAKRERMRTESQFLRAPAAVCVATMTLELGIDIGTVDYVLLLAVPSSVSSLLQRMGRGSRRGDSIRVGYACGSERDRFLFRVLFSKGAEGDLCADPYAFRPGVFLQQALVLAGAREYVDPARLQKIMPPALWPQTPDDLGAQILEKLEAAGYLDRQGGLRYVLTESGDRRYRRGVLHSNISSTPEDKVVDRLTGDEVGLIAAGAGSDDGGRLQLAGHGRRAVKVDGDRVLTDRAKAAPPAKFPSRSPPPMSFRLARAAVAELGATEERILQRPGAGGFILFHGLGTVGSLLLKRCLLKILPKGKVKAVGPLSILLGRSIQSLPVPAEQDLAELVAEEEQRLARLCRMGPYHRHLPLEIRRSSVREAAFLDGIGEFLARAVLVTKEEEAPLLC